MIFVQQILDDARRRLAVLSAEASLVDACEILGNPLTSLAVVCDSEGVAVGVISKTDLIKTIGGVRAHAYSASARAIMTKPFLSCHVDQTDQSVWETMRARTLRSVPVLDYFGRPQGVVYARDLVRALLDEVASEEVLLRDYVLGIGYR